jgi:hypothetical protein
MPRERLGQFPFQHRPLANYSQPFTFHTHGSSSMTSRPNRSLRLVSTEALSIGPVLLISVPAAGSSTIRYRQATAKVCEPGMTLSAGSVTAGVWTGQTH